jgi:hypothetical protein
MGPKQEGVTEIILWSNPDHFMVEEDQLMVELTGFSDCGLRIADCGFPLFELGLLF